MLGLSFTKARLCFCLATCLLQSVGKSSTHRSTRECITAAVGVNYCLVGVCNCRCYFSQRQFQFAQVASDNGSALPVLFAYAFAQSRPHRFEGFDQSAQSAQSECSFTQQPRLGVVLEC